MSKASEKKSPDSAKVSENSTVKTMTQNARESMAVSVVGKGTLRAELSQNAKEDEAGSVL